MIRYSILSPVLKYHDDSTNLNLGVQLCFVDFSYIKFLEKVTSLPELKNGAEILVVNKNHATDSIDDHSVYLAWDYFEFPLSPSPFLSHWTSHIERILARAKEEFLFDDYHHIFQYLECEPINPEVVLHFDQYAFNITNVVGHYH